MADPFTILFLRTANSARSIIAECALNRRGAGRFRAFSAGSHPTRRVHPLALRLLAELGYSTEALRSKSREEFARADGPRLDLVITVCDKAAGDACPIWPGHPLTAHWGVDDPAGFVGPPDKHLRFFHRVYQELDHRIKIPDESSAGRPRPPDPSAAARRDRSGRPRA